MEMQQEHRHLLQPHTVDSGRLCPRAPGAHHVDEEDVLPKRRKGSIMGASCSGRSLSCLDTCARAAPAITQKALASSACQLVQNAWLSWVMANDPIVHALR